MNASDLPDFRRVAMSESITFSQHAYDQMLNRGISVEAVKEVLGSNTNQIIEIQSPSTTTGKEHRNERYLIYDPLHCSDTIVISVLLFNPTPEIHVVTVEHPNNSTWDRHPGQNPALTRKH